MNVYIRAPFDEASVTALKKEHVLVYESWFDSGRILEGDELARQLRKYKTEIFVTEEDIVDSKVLDQVDTLKMICVCRGTPSNVDTEAARRKNVIVTSALGRNAVGVAEMAVGMILNLSRDMNHCERDILEGRWDDEYYFHSFHDEIYGKKIGFIGFGAIPHEMAKRLKGFEVKMYAYDPYVSAEQMAEYGVEKTTRLENLVKLADYLSNHLPVLESTLGILNYELLSKMRPQAYFINTARTKTTVEADVLRLLKEGKIAGAAFDVYGEEPIGSDSAYLKLNNVFLLPHIGGSTTNAIKKHSAITMQNIENYMKGKELVNRVV